MNASNRQLGVSFSLHRCSELGIEPKILLKAAVKDLGFRRFRLMSYWDIHETSRGEYDFTQLDWQMDLLAKEGCQVTLCLGRRQPRWPEFHIPTWARTLPQEEWYQALFDYLKVVVERYKNHPALESWQLENEALLKTFGDNPDDDYSHARLRQEFAIVKSADQKHPVIMTLSDSWGIPWRRPRADSYAMSMYRYTINKKGVYTASRRPALFYQVRAVLIKCLKFRSVFIHEMQAEPWLDRAIEEVSISMQLERMNPEILANVIKFSKHTNLRPIDLWGLEWWYWLKQNHNEPSIWNYIRDYPKN